MAAEPPELTAARLQVQSALREGWEPTGTDQYWLGQVCYALHSYLDLNGEWTAAHFEIWQHGLDMYSDVGQIITVVSRAFTDALAADLSPVVRTLLEVASTWEPTPVSADSPWRQLAWSLVPDEHDPY
ncbi:hypothetical protein [Kribbella sp. CA-293567]|uniref:hypothetical protein n=1 Tax=Kribbella sp. CA-293567 TaxID=3002436 RepID=UPI0022DE63B6|nr:hypothetical protein [Kribbella sp. CA-293567]WBQ02560.1 hypothetical protein OX958_21505 [Kribbella sp. CA-293567]